MLQMNFRKEMNILQLPKEIEVAIWLWNDPTTLNLKTMEHIFRKVNGYGISTIYVSIDGYLDIWDQKQPDPKKVDIFMQKLSALVETAEKEGVKIGAVSGNRTWALSDNWYLPIELMRFMLQYNLKYPKQQIWDLQFNIEYYNLPAYSKSQPVISRDYQELVRKLILNQGNLRLGFTIPYNLAMRDPETSKVIYELVSKGNSNYLVALTYRNTPSEILKIAKPIFDRDTDLPIQIKAAMETTNVKPRKITYFQESKSKLFKDTKIVDRDLKAYPQYAGVVIHDLEGFLKMQD